MPPCSRSPRRRAGPGRRPAVRPGGRTRRRRSRRLGPVLGGALRSRRAVNRLPDGTATSEPAPGPKPGGPPTTTLTSVASWTRGSVASTSRTGSGTSLGVKMMTSGHPDRSAIRSTAVAARLAPATAAIETPPTAPARAARAIRKRQAAPPVGGRPQPRREHHAPRSVVTRSGELGWAARRGDLAPRPPLSTHRHHPAADPPNHCSQGLKRYRSAPGHEGSRAWGDGPVRGLPRTLRHGSPRGAGNSVPETGRTTW